MTNAPDELLFSITPQVEFGSNTFENVPVILQYDDTPLLEVVQAEAAGFTSQFRIHGSDGAYLAKVVGSRIHLAADGRKANLHLRHPPLMTVCELDGKTLFEIRRKEAAAFSTEAELFTPDGRFVKATNSVAPLGLFQTNGADLRVGGMLMTGNRFVGVRVGILVKSDGTVNIGVK